MQKSSFPVKFSQNLSDYISKVSDDQLYNILFEK